MHLIPLSPGASTAITELQFGGAPEAAAPPPSGHGRAGTTSVPRASAPPETHHRLRAAPRGGTPDGLRRGHQRGRPGDVAGNRAVSRSTRFTTAGAPDRRDLPGGEGHVRRCGPGRAPGDRRVSRDHRPLMARATCTTRSSLASWIRCLSPRVVSRRDPSPAVRLEFPILSLHPGLRQRCVAPDVWPTLGVVA